FLIVPIVFQTIAQIAIILAAAIVLKIILGLVKIGKDFEFVFYILLVVAFRLGDVFINMPYFGVFFVSLRGYYEQGRQGFYFYEAVVGIRLEVAVEVGILGVLIERKFLNHQVIVVKIRRPAPVTGHAD